jgi:RNA polymerase sigma-70 factor (ECF subfamily)
MAAPLVCYFCVTIDRPLKFIFLSIGIHLFFLRHYGNCKNIVWIKQKDEYRNYAPLPFPFLPAILPSVTLSTFSYLSRKEETSILNNPAADSDTTGLLIQMADGDPTAFRAIYEQFQDKVFAYAWRFTKSRHTAVEVVQHVFIKLWEKRAGIDPKDHFEGYVMRITQNHILNLLRNTARDQVKKEQLLHNMQRLHHEPEEYLLEKELTAVYNNAIEALPPQKKIIYHLRHKEGLSHAAIAEQLQISPLTVKKHMAEAVKLIRQYVATRHGISCLVIAGSLHYLR